MIASNHDMEARQSPWPTVSSSDEIAIETPASIETERSILGVILLDESCYRQAAPLLRFEDFFLEPHRRIYRSMALLAESGRPIDYFTLSEELSRHGELEAIGGASYLVSLTDGTPRVSNIRHYISIVKEKALLRDCIQGSAALIHLASQSHATSEVVMKQWERQTDLLRKRGLCNGGISSFDDIPDVHTIDSGALSFLVPDLIARGTVSLLTGPPGVGKSLFALKLAVACTVQGEFLGRPCNQAVCLYLDKENPIHVVQRRIRAMAPDPTPALHIWGGWLSDEPPMLGDPRLTRFANESLLIVFDSLVRFHDAEENSATEMRNVMSQLRCLADAGATVLVLHHRSKADGSKYRGSTDILAAVDTAYTLERSNEFLILERFKSRFGPEQAIRMRADFEKGVFEVTGSCENSPDRDITTIRDYIVKHPGQNTRDICSGLQRKGIPRTQALKLLHQKTGCEWHMEMGEGKAKCYFPMSVPDVPPLKGREHRNTERSKCSPEFPRTPEHDDAKGIRSNAQGRVPVPEHVQS